MPDSEAVAGALYRRARFLLSAWSVSDLPPDEGLEVAVAGRSNAGKSSLINAVTCQGNLARTSKTPGRTQHMVVFGLDPLRRLVDLPGYGYARVAGSVKDHWRNELPRYLQNRRSLRGLVLLMDVRHPLTPLDQGLLDWSAAADLAVHVVLTKADKLSRGQAAAVQGRVRRQLPPEVGLQLFSMPQRLGLETLWACLDRWLGVEAEKKTPRS